MITYGKIENEKLKEAIKRIRVEKDLKSEQILLDEIKKAKYICPCIFDEEAIKDNNGNMVIDANTKIQFVMLRNNEIDFYFPAFTDFNEFESWFKNQDKPKSLVFDWKMYGDMIFGDKKALGFVINPGSENLIVNKNILLKLQKDELPVKVQEAQKIAIKEIGKEEYPAELVGNLLEYFDSSDYVLQAFIGKYNDIDDNSYVIVVEFEGILESKLFNNISKVASPYLKGHYLDLINYESATGFKAISHLKPFYSK